MHAPVTWLLGSSTMPCGNMPLASMSTRNPMLFRRPIKSQMNRTCCSLVRDRKVNKSLDQGRHCPHIRSQATHGPEAFDTGDRGRDRVRLPTAGESAIRGSGAETRLQEKPNPPAGIDYLAVQIYAIPSESSFDLKTQPHILVVLCRSLLLCSRVVQRILASLEQGTWASYIKI